MGAGPRHNWRGSESASSGYFMLVLPIQSVASCNHFYVVRPSLTAKARPELTVAVGKAPCGGRLP
jgi:hypothetical protein